MFERFTGLSRQVVVLAQEEARILEHEYIGPEHILLGVLREEEGLGARLLESLDITVERVRGQVVRLVGSGHQTAPGQIPFTHEAKKVLEHALPEAKALGHSYIGTEHILLGLVRENESVATQIVRDLGVDSETIRTEVIRFIAGSTRGGRAGRDFRDSSVPDRPLDWTGEPLRRLAREVEERLGRPVDAGDLLVLLASVKDGLAARTLAALGVDAEGLARAAEESRYGDTRSELHAHAALLEELDEVRVAKEAAIEAQELERARDLRDRERILARQADEVAVERSYEALLAAVRVRLGLTG